MTVYFAHDFTSPSARARRVAAGVIVPVGPGVWTDELRDPAETVVTRHWAEIVGRLLPGAVISDRTAFDLRPVDGQLFVAHPSRKVLRLPGLTIYSDGRADNRRADDVPLDTSGRLFGSSRTRALIDNAEQRGRPALVRRRLTTNELHDRVAQIVTTSTPRQIDTMVADIEREANAVATGVVRHYIDAARGIGPAVATGSRAMSAAQRGESFDGARVALFRQVAADLQRAPLVQRYVNDVPRAAFVPFYEAYFSNYIEGSTLTVDEARRVVFEDADVGKPEDAHDVRSTWEIVSSAAEMSRAFADADEFMDALRERHSVMMAAHPEKSPGRWKLRANQAGATRFVEPHHVPGTIRAGWEEGQTLTDPFQRAAYVMFLISEVHPFADGNGRSARVAMNGELVPFGMHRIVIPTVLRNEYLSGLTRATAGNGPDTLYRVLDRAQHWVANGEFSSLEAGDRYLRATNATTDSGVASIEGITLRILRVGEVWEIPDTEFPESVDASAPQPTFFDAAVEVAGD
jgi:Fic/DOC family